MNYYLQTLKKLQHHLSPKQCLLISRDSDIQYLTGFDSLVNHEREAYLLISAKSATLFYSAFSPIKKLSGINYQANCFLSNIIDFLKTKNYQQLLVDSQDLYLDEYLAFKKLSVDVKTFKREIIWDLRQIKNKDELKKLKQAGTLSNQAWQILKQKYLREGVTELELAKELECLLLKLGADGKAFPTIVAFGANTALAHHQPTEQKLKTEMPVLIDFGAKKAGYCSDMTRTIWFGKKPHPEFLKIKNIVKTAYQQGFQFLEKSFQVEAITSCSSQNNKSALAPIKSKKSAQASALPKVKDLDLQIRNFIKEAGYGKYFIHTSGHGVGLDIHEPQSIFYKNENLLKPQMVLTLEPGIYLAKKFGVRYENSILLK